MSVLSDIDPQYREKATIWDLFAQFPLFAPLAAGHIWRWFAINIPMDIVDSSGKFTSDIDIIARLKEYPPSQEWIYKCWEVKVSKICQGNIAKSLKDGKKIYKMTKQLKAYRDFGAPDVSLLDVYLCEAGALQFGSDFPPPYLRNSIFKKTAELRINNFGHQLLPFGHGRVGDNDVGLFVTGNSSNPLQTKINVLPSLVSQPKEPFVKLADTINDFFETSGNIPSNIPNPLHTQIVYCRNCRHLQLVNMAETYACPECGDILVAQ